MAVIAERFKRQAHDITSMLDALLSARPTLGELLRPDHLLQAMRYSVLNGGKRIRPILVLECAALFGGCYTTALKVGAALEMVHCYSLIHDDLPAMDNDDLRRGQPTLHIAYDEATAILAGDALLTYAFDIVTAEDIELSAEQKVKLVRHLSRAAGVGGMVGGQILDLAGEHNELDETSIISLQAMKTGALIRFACHAGAIVAGATDEDCERMIEFGSAIGLAFQIADDLLDVTADTNTLGKTAGKDVHANKATIVALHGVEWSRKQLTGLIDQASAVVAGYGEKAQTLIEIARYVGERQI